MNMARGETELLIQRRRRESNCCMVVLKSLVSIIHDIIMIHPCMTIYESSKGSIHFVEFSQNNYNKIP